MSDVTSATYILYIQCMVPSRLHETNIRLKTIQVLCCADLDTNKDSCFPLNTNKWISFHDYFRLDHMKWNKNEMSSHLAALCLHPDPSKAHFSCFLALLSITVNMTVKQLWGDIVGEFYCCFQYVIWQLLWLNVWTTFAVANYQQPLLRKCNFQESGLDLLHVNNLIYIPPSTISIHGQFQILYKW